MERPRSYIKRKKCHSWFAFLSTEECAVHATITILGQEQLWSSMFANMKTTLPKTQHQRRLLEHSTNFKFQIELIPRSSRYEIQKSQVSLFVVAARTKFQTANLLIDQDETIGPMRQHTNWSLKSSWIPIQNVNLSYFLTIYRRIRWFYLYKCTPTNHVKRQQWTYFQ